MTLFPRQTTSRMIRETAKYARPYLLPLAVSIILLGADLLMDVGLAWVQQLFVDTIHASDLDGLFLLIQLCAGISIGCICAFMIQFYIRNYTQASVTRDYMADVLSKVNRLPFRTMQQTHSGDLTSRITKDVAKATGILSLLVYEFGYQIVLCIVAFLYLAVIDVPLALLALMAGPIIYGVGRFFDRRMRALSAQIQEMDGVVRSGLQETMQGMKIIRTFTLESQFHHNYTQQRLMQNKLKIKREIFRSAMWQTVALTNMLVTFVCAFFAAWAAIRGTLTTGQVVAFIILMGRVQAPFMNASRTWGNVQESFSASDRVSHVMNQPDEQTVLSLADRNRIEAAHQVDGGHQSAAIELRDVSFTHDGVEGQYKLFDRLNLRVEAGETVAIVGASGSGKTTLARLCCGLYPALQGDVRIFGHSLRHHLNEARAMLTYVPQTSYLFTGTIRDNIAFGMTTATDAAVREAARQANAHGFIEQLDQKYDTLVGEHGLALSGGQRQRIAIARAFLRPAPLLILDEATSALDNESECEIQQSVERLFRDRTVLVIAHRLSTIRHATRIVVLDGGQICEQGDHLSLMQRDGLYARLYQTQLAGRDVSG